MKKEKNLNNNQESFDLTLVDQNIGMNDEQVKLSRSIYGENIVKKKKKTNIFIKFLKQFLDLMVLLLVIAGVITLILAIVKPPHDHLELVVQYVEVGVITFILLLNATVGVVQEIKAERDSEALSKLTSPNAKVLRNNQIVVIESKDVVVGDILVLEAGDWVVADAKLLKTSSLESDEAILTGESIPSKKDANAIVAPDAGIGDKTNYVFSGASITAGTARAQVTAVGMSTEIGKIAKLINDQKTPLTPLQRKINKLSKIIGIFASILCIVVFFIYVYLVGGGVWETAWHPALVIAISLSIAAIPEGVVAIVTVILSFGVKRMSKQNALIKRLPAVETLGSANVICSDKTGTLTQNKMTVTKVYVESSGLIELEDKNESVLKLIKYGSIANNGSMELNFETNQYDFVGDPTETSIISAAFKLGIKKQDLDASYKRVHELPFDSDRKLMSVIVENDKNELILITKGAIDSIESRLTTPFSKEVNDANYNMGSQALRVLGVAYKKIDKLPDQLDPQTLENNLTFVGLIGMIDPPRPEAKEAVEIAKNAGIRPVMITGDHINTASAIAKEIGILNPNQEVLSGAELTKMSDEELSQNIERYSVYARVSPSDKIRIVKAWQSHDKVVSMTGDGVNDAPALKAADIGCAMGITGTDVSKASSDMILTDDNFATIVGAVKMGRSIMDNIKRVIVLLLITNFAGLISLFFGILILGINPMSSLQILWINVISETLPGIALGLNFADGNLMRYAPLRKSAPIVDKKMWLTIFLNGFFIGFISILLFYLGSGVHYNFDFELMRSTFLNLNKFEHELISLIARFGDQHVEVITMNESISSIKNAAMSGSSLTFVFMGISLSFNALSLRSNHSIFIDTWADAKYVILSMSISIIMILVISYTPGVNNVFNMNPYGMKEYNWFNTLPYLFFIIPAIGFEIKKAIKYNQIKKTYSYKGISFIDLQQQKKLVLQKIKQVNDPKHLKYLNAIIKNINAKNKLLSYKCHHEI